MDIFPGESPLNGVLLFSAFISGIAHLQRHQLVPQASFTGLIPYLEPGGRPISSSDNPSESAPYATSNAPQRLADWPTAKLPNCAT
jgi:hypothetical protein